MEHLYFTDVSASIKKSTETIYEIKAPLASFDTIDLGDDEICLHPISPQKSETISVQQSIKSPARSPVPSPKGQEKSPKGQAKSSLKPQSSPKPSKSEKSSIMPFFRSKKADNKHKKEDKAAKPKDMTLSIPKGNCTQQGNDSPMEPEALTPTAAKSEPPTPSGLENMCLNTEKASAESDSTLSENESPTLTNRVPHNDDIDEPNSSENNASADDIQNKLKQKGRKYKEKSSNVKYEQIDNSDQERSDTASPMPALRFSQSPRPMCQGDSDSSDSEDGYSSGFVMQGSTRSELKASHIKSGLQNIIDRHDLGTDSVDSDSTPCASPQHKRTTVPPPLSKEDAKQRSKMKAYEKRLQRLQVTTTPIERPRSTTPINIFGLEEYASIGSPEKMLSSPRHSGEKLKIVLPLDDIVKTKSPRKSRTGDPHDVFNFNEDKLFTHMKSAVLVEDEGVKIGSPKRILLPPCMSPKMSPSLSPRSGSSQPRYIYSPKFQRSVENTDRKCQDSFSSSDESNWAKFEDVPKEHEIKAKEAETEFKDKPSSLECENEQDTTDCGTKEDKAVSSYDEVFQSLGFDNVNGKHEETEELLTINIEKSEGKQICDIKCDIIVKPDSGIVEKPAERGDNHTSVLENDGNNCPKTEKMFEQSQTEANEDEFESLC